MYRLRGLAVRAERRPVLSAGAGLLCLYLAVMSGHFVSIDGLVMWRQALALTYSHSFSLNPPIWWSAWLYSSYRGIGASLQYVPGLLVFFWLKGYVPTQSAANYDSALLYKDLLYAVAGAPAWALITAAAASVVGLSAKVLGGPRAALWAMALYGIGSPAFGASRGDWPQPIVGLCWAAGLYAVLRYRESRNTRWLWLSAASVFYGVMTRPLEGSLLLPGLLALLLPEMKRDRSILASQAGAWVAAVLLTLLLNWARFGSPFNLGYGQEAWTTPIWVGVPADLVSPGRGLLWEFPGLVLTIVGAVVLWRRGAKMTALVLAALPASLFLEAALYFDWPGGWDWGFRFFQPALPFVAVLAGVGSVSMPKRFVWLPAVLVVLGLAWNIPVVTTDLLGGYGQAYADGPANWQISAYPPIGAWRFVHHLGPAGGGDAAGIDIIWVRATRYVGWLALLPLTVLLGAAALLWRASVRSLTTLPRHA